MLKILENLGSGQQRTQYQVQVTEQHDTDNGLPTTAKCPATNNFPNTVNRNLKANKRLQTKHGY